MATVLLATDGSEQATAAMARGTALLGEGHRFLALSVVSPAFVPSAAMGPMDAHPTVLDPELEREIEAESQAESAQMLAALQTTLGVDLDPIVEVGEPGPTICEVAARVAADVVVVGSHGHGWLQRVLIGSVSQHVLHYAPCPVLVVRLGDHTG
jgi:nucleotide-binding universal stress UspA family protein